MEMEMYRREVERRRGVRRRRRAAVEDFIVGVL